MAEASPTAGLLFSRWLGAEERFRDAVAALGDPIPDRVTRELALELFRIRHEAGLAMDRFLRASLA